MDQLTTAPQPVATPTPTSQVTAPAAPAVKPAKNWRDKLRQFLKFTMPVLWLIIFIIPAYIFFSTRNGLSFLEGANLKTGSLLLFPLVGLYAFFFVWAQVMIGSNIKPLRKIYDYIDDFHRAEGLFALLFALIHPTLIVVGIGLGAYFAKKFVEPEMILFVWLGQLQLLAMILTVSTALLMRKKWMRKYWKKIHYTNYAVFVSAWIHSWFLGSDVQPTALRYLWFFFALTFLISVAGRIYRALKAKKELAAKLAATQAPTMPSASPTPPAQAMPATETK